MTARSWTDRFKSDPGMNFVNLDSEIVFDPLNLSNSVYDSSRCQLWPEQFHTGDAFESDRVFGGDEDEDGRTVRSCRTLLN